MVVYWHMIKQQILPIITLEVISDNIGKVYIYYHKAYFKTLRYLIKINMYSLYWCYLQIDASLHCNNQSVMEKPPFILHFKLYYV